MRSLVILLAAGSGLVQAAEVAVVLEFDRDHSARAVEAMEREVSNIFRDTGVHFDFRSRDELTSGVNDLVVFRFKGQCSAQPVAELLDERGPFAETAVTDGVVLPFGKVHCDRVRRSISEGIRSSNSKSRDAAYGKALGRVVAHELYHMLAKSRTHASSGINKASLSGAQLISDRLDLTAADIERFYNP